MLCLRKNYKFYLHFAFGWSTSLGQVNGSIGASLVRRSQASKLPKLLKGLLSLVSGKGHETLSDRCWIG